MWTIALTYVHWPGRLFLNSTALPHALKGVEADLVESRSEKFQENEKKKDLIQKVFEATFNVVVLDGALSEFRINVQHSEEMKDFPFTVGDYFSVFTVESCVTRLAKLICYSYTILTEICEELQKSANGWLICTSVIRLNKQTKQIWRLGTLSFASTGLWHGR